MEGLGRILGEPHIQRLSIRTNFTRLELGHLPYLSARSRPDKSSGQGEPKRIGGHQRAGPDDVNAEHASYQGYGANWRNSGVVNQIRERPPASDKVAALHAVHATWIDRAHFAGHGDGSQGGDSREDRHQ